MLELEKRGLTAGGEGRDSAFSPDESLYDGQIVQGSWSEITAIHTPGHMGNQMCFDYENVIFTGDHIMGWASSLISPPDGDLHAFMLSCEKLNRFSATQYLPGHGAPITTPKERLNWLQHHRRSREAQILDALSEASMSIPTLTLAVYGDLDSKLRHAAGRNIFAHLIALVESGKIYAKPMLSYDAVFAPMH